MAGKQQYPFKLIKDSIIKNRGFISQVAKELNCEPKTVYNYIERYPKLKQVLEDVREETLDFAESKLFTNIQSGNMTAIIFYLKTQGKKRGYIERVENINVDARMFKDIPPEVASKLTYIEEE